MAWRNAGKLKQGFLFEQKKNSRSYFKLVIRKCKSNSDKNKANILANQLLAKDENKFWTENKKINNNNVSIANCIDGVTGTSNIANKWKDHFRNVLNSSKDSSRRNIVLKHVDELRNLQFNRFHFNEIADKMLKSGKSANMDQLYCEHFKYAHSSINILLIMIFN